MNRAARLRLNPYQRELDRIGRGGDHWRMATASFKDGRYSEFVTKLFRAGKRNPSVAAMYSNERLEKALDNERGKPLRAFINHSRWIAQCECGGAEVVDDRVRKMYCFSCFNLLNDGYPRKIKFPRNYKRIEDILMLRDDPLTRNWLVSENTEDLEAENRAHGVPIQPPQKVK